MTEKFDPTPRPALRKAPDADIHPTTQTTVSTQDAVVDGKRVEQCAKIPKKLRKQMKAAAKAAGLSLDEFITVAIAAEVQRRAR